MPNEILKLMSKRRETRDRIKEKYKDFNNMLTKKIRQNGVQKRAKKLRNYRKYTTLDTSTKM